MTNLEKLENIFSEVFSIEASSLDSSFDKNTIENWDSVHQLYLTSAIEDEFDIMLDSEDILEFTSYENAKTILKKYDIEL